MVQQCSFHGCKVYCLRVYWHQFVEQVLYQRQHPVDRLCFRKAQKAFGLGFWFERPIGTPVGFIQIGYVCTFDGVLVLLDECTWWFCTTPKSVVKWTYQKRHTGVLHVLYDVDNGIVNTCKPPAICSMGWYLLIAHSLPYCLVSRNSIILCVVSWYMTKCLPICANFTGCFFLSTLW